MLIANIQISDDPDGWPMVKVAARDRTLLGIPYYVDQKNIVAVRTKRVKVGDTFTVQWNSR